VDPVEGAVVKAIRTLIVDDEPLARETLRVLLRADPEVDVVGECRSGPEAVDRTLELEPDLVFLDIQMPEMDGFDVLETLAVEGVRIPTIVFVTAYDQYALRAFEVHALDYLLKPFDDERFERALERAKLELSRRQDAAMASRIEALLADHRAAAEGEESAVGEEREGPVERFVVRSSGRIHFVDVGEVDWVEAAGDYVRLHTGERSHLMRETMKELEDSLDPDVFVRIHRSTIVRIGFVKEIRTTGTGQYVVLLEDGTRRNLSRSGRRRLEEVLGRAL
jgi:two-component system LytT family response regulator